MLLPLMVPKESNGSGKDNGVGWKAVVEVGHIWMMVIAVVKSVQWS